MSETVTPPSVTQPHAKVDELWQTIEDTLQKKKRETEELIQQRNTALAELVADSLGRAKLSVILDQSSGPASTGRFLKSLVRSLPNVPYSNVIERNDAIRLLEKAADRVKKRGERGDFWKVLHFWGKIDRMAARKKILDELELLRGKTNPRHLIDVLTEDRDLGNMDILTRLDLVGFAIDASPNFEMKRELESAMEYLNSPRSKAPSAPPGPPGREQSSAVLTKLPTSATPPAEISRPTGELADNQKVNGLSPSELRSPTQLVESSRPEITLEPSVATSGSTATAKEDVGHAEVARQPTARSKDATKNELRDLKNSIQRIEAGLQGLFDRIEAIQRQGNEDRESNRGRFADLRHRIDILGELRIDEIIREKLALELELKDATTRLADLDRELKHVLERSMIAEKRAEQNIHEANQASENSLRDFQARLWEELESKLSDLQDPANMPGLSTKEEILIRRLRTIREILRRNDVPPT